MLQDLVVRFVICFIGVCLYDKYINPRLPPAMFHVRDGRVQVVRNLVISLIAALLGMVLFHTTK